MASITIPFSREMAIAAIDGRKVATIRSEAKGEIGDVFCIYSNEPKHYHVNQFRLLEIMAVDLLTIRNIYFRLEGFDSPEAFEETWMALHQGHFTTDKLYYIHFFGRVA